MARILCVDDESDALLLKCAILDRAGHTAIPAPSVTQAMAHLLATPFDAIVMDWQLGAEDGHLLLQQIKQLSAAPVIVVSGYVFRAFQSSEPTADIYLEKPVDPSELVTILETLLRPSADAATLAS